MLLEHRHPDAGAREQQPQHHSRRAAAGNAALHVYPHPRSLALRELHHALARLQRLVEGKEDLMDDLTIGAVDAATHRRLAIDFFNRSGVRVPPLCGGA